MAATNLLDQKSVIVSNLSKNTTKEMIFESFKDYGFIKNINLDLAKLKAFVNFGDGNSAKSAQESMDNKRICGATITTKLQMVTHSVGMNYQPLTDCKFFLNGNCQKGEACPYRHKVTSSDTICHLWNNRNCKNVNCAYPHPALKNVNLTSKETSDPVNPYSTIKWAQSPMLVPVIKQAPVFKEGMTVEVRIDQKPHIGIVRWEGTVPEFLGDDKFIGIQLSNKVGTGTDGTFFGQRFFTCSEGYGVLIKASICKVVSNTVLGSELSAKKYICCYYLRNVCMAGENCSYIHPPILSTYVWCYKPKAGKDEFKFCKVLNDEIEKAFCDPNLDKFEMVGGYVNFIVPEKSEYMFNPTTFVRYSTESHVLIPKEEKATKWKWYWLDDNKKWNEYQVAQSATSDMIEEGYINWIKNGGSVYFKFSNGTFSYRLNFNKMRQRNLDQQYKTIRPVKRRPVYIDIRVSEELSSSLPSHWPAALSGKEYQLLSIDSSTESEIRRKFEVTMKSVLTYEIVSIKEVCNKEFFNKYTSKKKAMKETCKNISELQLWHGTSHTYIQHICHQNFDFRLCKTGAFGQGCYFARDASYSHNYSDMNDNSIYCMFLADVLVGEYTKGKSSYKRPPEKEKFKLYDSCVNDITNPSIYVIFERDQCYPRYLLKYKRKNAL